MWLFEWKLIRALWFTVSPIMTTHVIRLYPAKKSTKILADLNRSIPEKCSLYQSPSCINCFFNRHINEWSRQKTTSNMMNTVPTLTPTSTDQQRQNISSSTRAATSQINPPYAWWFRHIHYAVFLINIQVLTITNSRVSFSSLDNMLQYFLYLNVYLVV